MNLRASVCLLLMGASLAEELTPVVVHGLVSQGYLITTGNDPLVANCPDGTFRMREILVNGTWTPAPAWRAGVQMSVREFGVYGGGIARLDYANVDWHADDAFAIQIGRVKFARGLYWDAIDVDPARTTIFLPISFYPFRLREFDLADNGGKVYGHLDLDGFGSLDYLVSIGYGIYEDDGDFATLLNQGGSTVDDLYGRATGSGMLHWDTPLDGFSLRGTVRWSRGIEIFAHDQAGNRTYSQQLPYHIVVGSAQWMESGWTLTGEWSWTTGKTSTVVTNPGGTVLFKSTSDLLGEGGYISLSRRLLDRFDLYAARELAFANRRQPGRSYHRSWVLAARYDLTSWWLVKAEWQWIDGTLNAGSKPTDRVWQMLAFKTTVDF